MGGLGAFIRVGGLRGLGLGFGVWALGHEKERIVVLSPFRGDGRGILLLRRVSSSHRLFVLVQIQESLTPDSRIL